VLIAYSAFSRAVVPGTGRHHTVDDHASVGGLHATARHLSIAFGGVGILLRDAVGHHAKVAISCLSDGDDRAAGAAEPFPVPQQRRAR
jgi:hypothetical protein